MPEIPKGTKKNFEIYEENVKKLKIPTLSLIGESGTATFDPNEEMFKILCPGDNDQFSCSNVYGVRKANGVWNRDATKSKNRRF